MAKKVKLELELTIDEAKKVLATLGRIDVSVASADGETNPQKPPK